MLQAMYSYRRLYMYMYNLVTHVQYNILYMYDDKIIHVHVKSTARLNTLMGV